MRFNFIDKSILIMFLLLKKFIYFDKPSLINQYQYQNVDHQEKNKQFLSYIKLESVNSELIGV